MIEKLFPLNPPPGLYRNGTRNQAAGRWYDGNQVRFYQGNKQPIGGWTARTITGVANTGVPNAAICVLRNDSTAYLVYGTSHKLFVVDSSNVRYDITPSTVSGQTDIDWHLETFGQLVIAIAANHGDVNGNNVFAWDGDTGAVAVLAGTLFPDVIDYFDLPNTVYGAVATPERFLFLLQGADPAVGLSVSSTNGVTYRAARSGYVQTLSTGPLLID